MFVMVAPGAHAARPGGASVSVSIPARPAAVAGARFDAAVRRLETTTGARWTLRWDPWTGVARRGVGGRPGTGPPGDERALWRAALAFRDTNAELLGASGVELRGTRWTRSGHAWHATWQQMHAGRRVRSAFLDLTLHTDGDVVAFRSGLVPEVRGTWPGSNVEAARAACAARLGQALVLEDAAEVWAVMPRVDSYEIVPALELHLRGTHGAPWSALVGSTGGRILELESTLRHERISGQATTDVRPLYAHDAPEPRPLPHLELFLQRENGTFGTFSDAAGAFGLEAFPGVGTLTASLHGRFVSVTHDSPGGPSPGFSRTVEVPGEALVHFGDFEARDDERSIYVHTNVIHTFVRDEFDFTLLDFPVPAVAAVRNPVNGAPDYANAFWDGSRMGFGNGGATMQNLGLFADVIYHEYTHAITDYMYRPAGGLHGYIGGAIHEALSDYFACTLTDEPLVGEFLRGGPDYLRNLDNRLLWPEDRHPSNAVHANGEILAGALWDLRTVAGAGVADRVIHFARELFPQDFEEYLDAILIQDDLIYGDGAPGNGSPHRDEILSAFALHGIGPLGVREVRIRHTALTDTEAIGEPRLVRASIGSLLPGVVDEMRLHWSVDGADFQVVVMQADDRGGFVAEIPGQPTGSDVAYCLSTIRRRPFEEYRLPAEEDEYFRYHVGPDLTPPTIAHARPGAVAAFSWPASLRMRIVDNLGLAYAFVEYVYNGIPGPTLGLVASPDDPTLYTARFPHVGGVVGDVIEYSITAVDASRAAHQTRFPEAGRLRIRLQQELEENFEQGAGSWFHRAVVAAQPDPWHISTLFNRSPGGTQAWLCGVEAGEYPAQTAAELVSDWYDIGDGARASIWSWMDAEQNGPPGSVGAFDGGVIEIQTDGGRAWESLVPEGGYTHTMSETAGTNVLRAGTRCLSGTDADWRLLTFDLAPWGRQRVRLRFLFGSDNVVTNAGLRGWLLDDLRLEPGVRHPSDASPQPPRARVLVAPPAPNPFNPRVVFRLEVPDDAGRVRLSILDPRGRLVARLVDAVLQPGSVRLVWNGLDSGGHAAASGVYFYRLESVWGTERGKLALLR